MKGIEDFNLEHWVKQIYKQQDRMNLKDTDLGSRICKAPKFTITFCTSNANVDVFMSMFSFLGQDSKVHLESKGTLEEEEEEAKRKRKRNCAACINVRKVFEVIKVNCLPL